MTLRVEIAVSRFIFVNCLRKRIGKLITSLLQCIDRRSWKKRHNIDRKARSLHLECVNVTMATADGWEGQGQTSSIYADCPLDCKVHYLRQIGFRLSAFLEAIYIAIEE